MPLRHPAVALAKANRLKSPQNSSEVYKAHVEARLSQRLTDRQNDKTVSKTANGFEIRFHHVKTNLCKTRASVSNYGLGTFGRSRKPTPPLDQKVPVN